MMVRPRQILNIRPTRKTHYSYGAGERHRALITVVCGANARTDNDLWVTDVKTDVTCGSCQRHLS